MADFTGRRALIVGCGYLGRRVARVLQEQGALVFGTTRSPEKARELNALGITPVEFDLLAPRGVATLPPADDVVLTTAASGRTDESYRQLYGSALPSLIRQWPSSTRPQRMIYSSSTGVYDLIDGSDVTETTPVSNGDEKRRALVAAENAVLRAAWPSIVLRLGGIYGPGRNRLSQIRDEVFRIEGADNWGNNIHVDDAARALVFLLKRGAPGEIYLGVDSRPAKRGEIYRWIAARMGAKPPPVTAERTAGRRSQNKRCLNAKLLALGFEFRYPSYQEGYEALLRLDDA